MQTVNKENLRKWRDALLSKQYAQGMHVLRTAEDKFCCLGVACDISNLGTWEKLYPDSEDPPYYEIDEHNGSSALLPEAVSDWLGIYGPYAESVKISLESVSKVIPEYAGEEEWTSLTGLNDDGASFENIAKIITLEFGLDDQ